LAPKVTVAIDDDLLEKIRQRQSQKMKKLKKSVSFKKTVNELIIKGLSK